VDRRILNNAILMLSAHDVGGAAPNMFASIQLLTAGWWVAFVRTKGPERPLVRYLSRRRDARARPVCYFTQFFGSRAQKSLKITDHLLSGIDAPCTFGSGLMNPYEVTPTTRFGPLLKPIPA
jgi:hypothetical protein